MEIGVDQRACGFARLGVAGSLREHLAQALGLDSLGRRSPHDHLGESAIER